VALALYDLLKGIRVHTAVLRICLGSVVGLFRARLATGETPKAVETTKRLLGRTPRSRMLPVLTSMPRAGVREVRSVLRTQSLMRTVSWEGTPS
jgi:hypothetical protein